MTTRIRLLLIFCVLVCCNVAFPQKQHTIQRGETYELIARRYNISLEELMAVNPNEDGCFVGMVINIPEGRKMNTQLDKSTPKDLSMLENAANLVKSGKYKKATSVYSDVLKHSSSASAYFGRGISYYNRKKYKSAIEDFEHALSCADCSDEMQERCKELISNAKTLRAEQHERRSSVWGEVAAIFVGAAAITATAAMSSNNSGTMYMPPSNMNGFQRDTSLDYLLDPRYAIMQVQQEYYNEYLQMTNGGRTMTYEEWFNKIKGPALAEEYRIEHGLSNGTNQDDADEYKGELSPDQYQAAYRRWESRVQDWFNNLTTGGYKVQDKQGNIKGKTDSEMKGWAYVGNQSGLKRAQNEMRKIRLEAEKYGVHIQQSKWETATSSY